MASRPRGPGRPPSGSPIRRFLKSPHPWLSGLVLVTGGLLFSSLAWNYSWPIELLAHHRLQQGFLFLLLATVLYYFGWLRYGAIMAGLGVIPLLIAGYSWVVTANLSAPEAVRKPTLSVGYLHVRRQPETVRGLIQAAERRKTDVLLIIGVTNQVRDDVLTNPPEPFKHVKFIVHDNKFGAAVLSRDPVETFEEARVEIPGRTPWYRVRWPEASSRPDLWLLHTTRPTQRVLFQYRNRMYRRLKEFDRGDTIPPVTVGDFNSSVNTPLFRDALIDSSWQKAGTCLVCPTWRAGWFPSYVGIDHALYRTNSAYLIKEFEIGESHGSAHYSLWFDVFKRARNGAEE